jgi:hypothetical protein
MTVDNTTGTKRPDPVEIEKSEANQLQKAMANGERKVVDKLLPLVYGE